MLKHHIGGQINYLSRQIIHAVDDRLSKEGLSFTTIRILGQLEGCEAEGKEVCQRDIASRTCTRAPSVTSVLRTMERDGLIARYGGKEDGRVKYLRLTEKGRAAARRGRDCMDEVDRKLLSGMEEAEVQMFRSYLERANCNLRN